MQQRGLLVLGTAQLGLPYGVANRTGKPDRAMAISIIREAWENGIKEFDTAQGYGDSERVLGEALAELGLSQKVKIITKFNPDLDHLNAPAMSRSLDQSLQRLGIQSLYGIMLHREELLSLWHNGLSEIIHDLVLSGGVKQTGVSVYSPDKAIQALNTEGIDMVQLPMNILDRRFENAGVFQLADKKKKQIYIRSVFLQGLLLMDPEEIPANMAFARPVLKKLESLSRDLGLTRQEMALGYLKLGMPNAHVIFGAETQHQVKENVITWQKKIPESLVNQVRVLFPNVSEHILNPVLWFR
jgi:aryl-alcohol dehydrogenase-like predicted oxidoreductase